MPILVQCRENSSRLMLQGQRAYCMTATYSHTIHTTSSINPVVNTCPNTAAQERKHLRGKPHVRTQAAWYPYLTPVNISVCKSSDRSHTCKAILLVHRSTSTM